MVCKWKVVSYNEHLNIAVLSDGNSTIQTNCDCNDKKEIYGELINGRFFERKEKDFVNEKPRDRKNYYNEKSWYKNKNKKN